MKARRAPDPLASYRNRANAATGEAAELAWVAEQVRYGALMAWAKPGNRSPRYNRDILGLWDTIALTASYTVLSQVKITDTDPWPPAPIWRTRFMGSPHPPGMKYLLAWLTPEEPARWRVWRLLPDGTRLEVAWPPPTPAGRPWGTP